ncbi:hypothetical protein HanIR_Chr07g0321591 [Helianthus annuus]|nr:hypothetical protein HanIR_Chr07g0321591 [Helianthus annuus]
MDFFSFAIGIIVAWFLFVYTLRSKTLSLFVIISSVIVLFWRVGSRVPNWFLIWEYGLSQILHKNFSVSISFENASLACWYVTS